MSFSKNNYSFSINKHNHLLKKTRWFLIYIFIIFSLILSSCEKKQAYIFYNKDYCTVFKNQLKIYNNIKKKLNRDFFKVNEIKIESFASLTIELDKLKKNKTKGIMFLNDSLSSLLVKNASLSDKTELKLFTYNIPQTDIHLEPKLPIFNVNIDHTILTKKIIKILNKYSKKKKDLSDCGIVINPDYSLCMDVISDLSNAGFNLDVLEVYENKEIIKNWLNKKDKNVVVFFAYKSNNFILDIEKNKLTDLIYIEVLTGYGELSNHVKYKIDINWEYAINYSLDSNNFKKFSDLNKKNNNKDIIYNYIVKYNNVVFSQKYIHKKPWKKIKKIKPKDILNKNKADIKKDDNDKKNTQIKSIIKKNKAEINPESIIE